MKRMLRKGILTVLAVILMLSAGGVSRADEVVFGDADGDGELTAQDASCIYRHLNRFRIMDAAAETRADFDGDGEVTENDASLILSAFMATEFLVPSVKSFSMLVTSDLNGNAWDPLSTEEDPGLSAMNTAACAMTMREEEPDLLLLDAGGSLFGSTIADEYTTYTERSYGPITTLFIKMQYDAVLLGGEALSYPSNKVRREVNELLYRKIPVLGANLLKSDPTIFDPKDVLWNDLVSYVILEVPQGEEKEPARVAVIGMTQPDLYPAEDEVLPIDPLEAYARIRKELKGQVDYTVLLYHGNAETDDIGNDSYSLRDMLKKTDSIDLVLCANGSSYGIRSERNYLNDEIPIITLAGGAGALTRVNVSLRANGRPAILVEPIDTGSYLPDDSIRRAIRQYTSNLTKTMDTSLCTVEERIETAGRGTLGSTDFMEIVHEMQIFAARDWIDYNELDLPQSVVSIAYPYIKETVIQKGTLTYRDLCRFETETPQYTLMLVRGSELRAWLTDYAGTIMQDDTIHSLYGLSYLLNTLNPEVPLGFLEHSSGIAVDDDEIFTLISADIPGSDPVIRPYLDETWMPYEDRVIEGFYLPMPWSLNAQEKDPVVDALAAYLETLDELKLSRTYSWIVI